LNPVITPPALTVTSAVACCHHAFLAMLTGTLLSVAGYRPLPASEGQIAARPLTPLFVPLPS
jgi:hypothetical protein